MPANIDEKLKKIIIKNLKMSVPQEDITDDVNIIKLFALDSLQVVKIMVDIEIEFDIKFENEGEILDVLVNYKKLKDYIVDKIA
ncbi:MAG: phosphopantetheine-binding protein [Clostridia bacterium]|nr:phosphopantetheine-binding protein [Clostridia bacterium]